MQYTMDMFGTAPSGYTAVSSMDIFDTSTMGWSAIVGYTIAILLVLMVILLLINYTITPIFQLQPGGPGYIRVPFMDTNEKYWAPQSSPYEVPSISGDIVNNASLSSGWSMSLDISIMNPVMQIKDSNGNSTFRLIFNRGGTYSEPVGTDGSIASVITGYNIAIGLLKDTNDLIVSVMNGNSVPENIILHNVPVQQPFRIGVVIMNNAFEVYMNGKLVKTRKMVSAVPSFTSRQAFYGPQGSIMNQIARVGNLILWSNVETPSIMKYATPALMSAVPGMDNLSASAGTQCGASLSSSVGETIGSLTTGLTGLATGTISSLTGTEQAQQSLNVQNAIAQLGSTATSATSLIGANATINNPY
jgi:hypothetical protein